MPYPQVVTCKAMEITVQVIEEMKRRKGLEDELDDLLPIDWDELLHDVSRVVQCELDRDD